MGPTFGTNKTFPFNVRASPTLHPGVDVLVPYPAPGLRDFPIRGRGGPPMSFIPSFPLPPKKTQIIRKSTCRVGREGRGMVDRGRKTVILIWRKSHVISESLPWLSSGMQSHSVTKWWATCVPSVKLLSDASREADLWFLLPSISLMSDSSRLNSCSRLRLYHLRTPWAHGFPWPRHVSNPNRWAVIC